MYEYVVDKIGNHLNHDKIGFLRRIRFCPSCGTQRLEPSERMHDSSGKPIQGHEVWCSLCGFSCNIRISTEWGLALRLFKTHRQMRTQRKAYEPEMDPEAVKVYRQQYMRPKVKPLPLFLPASTWNLADKLKRALRITNG